eukprot:1081-Pyramimonas_sp.AAC.1
MRAMLDTPLDEIEEGTGMSLPVYARHPATVRAQEEGLPRPLPLTFYLDGVQFRSPAAGRTDSVLGLWCTNLLSRQRHLISNLRGSDSCGCGCKGWCSMYPHLLASQWMFAAMQDGNRPQEKHDGSE